MERTRKVWVLEMEQAIGPQHPELAHRNSVTAQPFFPAHASSSLEHDVFQLRHGAVIYKNIFLENIHQYLLKDEHTYKKILI